MFLLNNKNFVVAPEWTITQLHRNTPNIFLSRLSIKMGFSMCMHQMKRAEVSGWKHYKKVLFKKSLKGVADWVLWDLVEKVVAIKGPTTKTESVDFPPASENVLHSPSFCILFCYLEEAWGSDSLSCLVAQSWCCALCHPAAGRKSGHLLSTHCACLYQSKV